MKKLRELLQRRNERIKTARAILDKAESEERADLTPDEQAAYGRELVEVDKLDKLIEREELQLSLEASVGATGGARASAGLSVGDGADVRGHAGRNPWFPSGYTPRSISTPLAHRLIHDPLDEDARIWRRGFGEYLAAVMRAGMGGGFDQRLVEGRAATGMGEVIGADGGFLLQTDFATELLRRAYQTGEILSRVRKATLSPQFASIEIPVIDETSRVTGSRWGAVQAYWVDEGVAPTATKPRLGKLRLQPRKIAALGYAGDELLADVALTGQLYFEAFSDEIRFLVEDSIINGTGAGAPQGLLNAAALVSQAKEVGQAAATIVKENIDKMWSRAHAANRAGSVWLINQDDEPSLEALALNVGTGGVPVYLPPGGYTETPNARLKGRPVIPVEYCATLGTVGDIILVDLSEYQLIDKGGPQQASSIHIKFDQDETAFRVTYRVDGRCRWLSSYIPFKGANTRSCVVALATRA